MENQERPLQTKKQTRSTAYPFIKLEKAVVLIEKLVNNLGEGPYDRESIVNALGYKGITGSSQRTVAALAHFGFLSRAGGNYYRSDLAKKILYHKSDEEKKQSIQEAFKTPKLYHSLIRKYSNKPLPLMLSNILIQEHSINPKVSKKVSDNFKHSAEYANLLQNGVIVETPHRKTSVANEKVTPTNDLIPKETNEAKTSTTSKNLSITDNMFKVHLSSGVVIQFPQEMTYRIALGDFAEPIKKLEKITNEVKSFSSKKKDITH